MCVWVCEYSLVKSISNEWPLQCVYTGYRWLPRKTQPRVYTIPVYTISVAPLLVAPSPPPPLLCNPPALLGPHYDAPLWSSLHRHHHHPPLATNITSQHHHPPLATNITSQHYHHQYYHQHIATTTTAQPNSFTLTINQAKVQWSIHQQHCCLLFMYMVNSAFYWLTGRPAGCLLILHNIA